VTGIEIEKPNANGEAPAAMPSGAGQSRRTKSEAVRELFKAAIKAVTLPGNDAPEPDARKRRSGEKDGGGPLLVTPRSLQHGGRPAARGPYAALHNGKARTGKFDMEAPAVQSGSFSLSLCDPFGSPDYEEGGLGVEAFDVPPEISANLISLNP
jgi:hypothetical protein